MAQRLTIRSEGEKLVIVLDHFEGIPAKDVKGWGAEQDRGIREAQGQRRKSYRSGYEDISGPPIVRHKRCGLMFKAAVLSAMQCRPALE